MIKKNCVLIIIKLLLFCLFFPIFSFGYGGPTVNDRNVIPVYTPSFEKPNFNKAPGKLNINNSGSKNSGYTKSTLSYSFKDFLKPGDTFGLKQIHTGGNGTNYYEINNKTPLENGATVYFRTGRLRYDLDHYALSLGLEGHSNFIDVDYIKPILSEKNKSVKVGIGYFRSNFRVDKDRGGYKEEDTTIDKINFSLHSSTSDNLFKKAKTNFRVIYSIGRVNLADDALELSPTNDPAGVNGYFAKINPAFARREQITDGLDLILKFKGQYAFKNLEGTEEFTLGGFYNVRSYPNNEAGGDTGYITTLELEKKINQKIKVGLLYDYGKILENKKSYDGNNNYSYHLSTAGLYADIEDIIPGYNLKIMYIDRLRSNNPGARADETDYDRSYHPKKFLMNLTKEF